MPRKTVRKKSLLDRRRGLYIGAAVVILAAAIGAYALTHKTDEPVQGTAQAPASSQKIDYSPATRADNAPNDVRKGSSKPTSTLNNYQPPANTGSFSVTITRAGLDSAKQNLQVAALTNGVTSGTCALNVHQDGQPTVSSSEPVTLQVNTYACPVMNIPLSRFPNKGAWNVSMTVESNGQTVSSDWAKNPVSLN